MATRSPFSTPSSVRPLAALHTSRLRSAYVIVRVSPGSPSQWKATLSPLPASTCRSTQLYAALSVPPVNHLANGGLDQSRTVSHRLFQWRRPACFSQKASGSADASPYTASVTLAAAASSYGG